MADQTRRAAYRTPYPPPRVPHLPNAVGVREFDDDDEEEENENVRRNLQMVSTQKKDTVPMSDDERFFGRTSFILLPAI